MAASGRAILLARDVEGSEGVGKYSQPCIIVCIMCTQASCSYIAVLYAFFPQGQKLGHVDSWTYLTFLL